MGHKPWDRAWRRADKAKERNAARAEIRDDVIDLDDLIDELGFTQAEIEAAD